MTLYEISGRRFAGSCGPTTVRPCRDNCSCWGQPSAGIGPWAWTLGVPWGTGGGAYWYNECGDRCGCGSLSRVWLAGYPVREIIEVRIDGDVLDPIDADGNPNYRLDAYQYLVRMDAPGPPVVKRTWPRCQNLALDDDQPGTFAVTYLWGVDPPIAGINAAAELACELFKACNAMACSIPSNAVKIQRQGVTIDRNILLSFLDPKKPSGLLHLDLFLRAYGLAGRTPALWSPDLPRFARQVGA